VGKSPQKELAQVEGKLAAALGQVAKVESELRQVRNRLARKAQELAEAKQGRKEALTLLREAAGSDPALRERVIALLAADALVDAKGEDGAVEALTTKAEAA
jgi:hypothetical protein